MCADRARGPAPAPPGSRLELSRQQTLPRPGLLLSPVASRQPPWPAPLPSPCAGCGRRRLTGGGHRGSPGPRRLRACARGPPGTHLRHEPGPGRGAGPGSECRRRYQQQLPTAAPTGPRSGPDSARTTSEAPPQLLPGAAGKGQGGETRPRGPKRPAREQPIGRESDWGGGGGCHDNRVCKSFSERVQ